MIAIEKMNFDYKVRGGDENIRPLRVLRYCLPSHTEDIDEPHTPRQPHVKPVYRRALPLLHELATNL